jgi:hypothetical protein
MENAAPSLASPNLPLNGDPPELSAPVISDIPGPWCVVRTKSRTEKQLARYCLDHKIHYYLPYVPGSRDGILLPMFSGFMFAAFPSANRWELELIKSSHCYHGFLYTDNQPRLQNELAFIAGESALTRTLKLERTMPRTGSRVRIKIGPFKDFEGFVTDINTVTCKVFVMLVLMGQPVSRQVPHDQIEVLA